MADNATVTIQINGAPIGVQNGQVFAFLLQENVSQWTATSAKGGIQFIEQSSGNVLAAPDTAPYTQLVANSTDASQPNSVWTVLNLDDGATVSTIDESGMYALVMAAAGEPAGRNPIEDYSLQPKRVVMLPPGMQPPRIVIRVQ